jgi:hypothetical protein
LRHHPHHCFVVLMVAHNHPHERLFSPITHTIISPASNLNFTFHFSRQVTPGAPGYAFQIVSAFSFHAISYQLICDPLRFFHLIVPIKNHHVLSIFLCFILSNEERWRSRGLSTTAAAQLGGEG